MSGAQEQALVLIMAGGTGGHVFPALACARGLREENIAVHWLGTAQGLEARLVPEAGIPISYLNIGGVRGKGLLILLLAPFRLLRALWQALKIIRRLKPRAVIGLGGFASGPGGLAAFLLRVPLLIHEQNAIPGTTNYILSYLARRVMQAFPDTFPASRRAVTTGNPLRPEISALAARPLNKPHKPLRVLVIGGSLGALVLNQTIPQALRHAKEAIQVWHQSGAAHLEKVQQLYAEHKQKGRVEAFIEDMAAAYTWADLVVCRAGALTVSELAEAGKPSILVPFPHAIDDHQTHNAGVLVNSGAALLMPQPGHHDAVGEDSILTPENLARVLDELSVRPLRLRQMAETARRCAHPDALRKVVEECLEILPRAFKDTEEHEKNPHR